MLSQLSPRSIVQVLLSAVFGRLSTALSQVIAAIYLQPDDFGVYAAAVGITTIATGLRAGGTGNHVQTMTPAEFDSDAGRFFRYSLLFTTLGAILTALLVWPMANWYADTRHYPLRPLIFATLAVGGSFVVFNLNVFPRARMIADLRLGEISLLDTVTGATKLLGTWMLAWAGFGALALAGSILAAQMVETAWTWCRSGLRPAGLGTRKPWVRRTFDEMRLPLVMGLMVTLNSQTDSLVGSAFVPVAVLGFYFFASQLAAQPATLVGNTLRAVFTATTAQVRGDPAKEQAALRTVFSGAMVFMPLVTMIIPAVFESFERAAWNGKWADSRYPVLILSATLVYPTALQLVAAPIAGLRDWKLAIRLDALRAVAKLVPAAIAGACILWLKAEPTTSGIVLASAVGGASAIVSSVELVRIMSRAGMPRHSIAYELYATPLFALLSAVGVPAIVHSLAEPLRVAIGDRPAAAVECALSGFTYVALAFVLLRFGYTPTLERLVAALPDFMRPHARRIFVL